MTLRQLMSHALHFLHPMSAKTALATVNTEVGLDYWLPGDAHQELQRVRHGGHLAASSPAPPRVHHGQGRLGHAGGWISGNPEERQGAVRSTYVV